MCIIHCICYVDKDHVTFFFQVSNEVERWYSVVLDYGVTFSSRCDPGKHRETWDRGSDETIVYTIKWGFIRMLVSVYVTCLKKLGFEKFWLSDPA